MNSQQFEQNMRIRVIFSKTDNMRYTSHLDLHRAWERTIRRAQLPLSYSKGFNPRPKINLAMALPLGFTSDCEILELWLDQEVSIIEIENRLKSAVPPGIKIQSIEAIDLSTPKIPNLVKSAEYRVELLVPLKDLEKRALKIMEEESLPRERRGKPYDLRPLIEEIQAVPSSNRIDMRLSAESGATGRPEEVLSALGIDPLLARYHRKALLLKPD